MSRRTAAPLHGNYHGYYTKRPFVRDPRLALLPPQFFEHKRVLDVGCNEGWVTCEIAQSKGASQVVGVDIDADLIRGAWKRRRTLWSQHAPDFESQHTPDDDHASKSDRPMKRPRIDSEDDNIFNYFPVSCEHTYGPLPIPDSTQNDSFPHNVSFRVSDWVENGIPDDKELYDVILAFSISKWIHLNSGDAGIKQFFQRVHDSLKPGGAFVLEPQAWDTYAKAKRMVEKLKENAKRLKLRPESFGLLLQEMGFGPAQSLGFAGDGGFYRPVDLYVKIGN